MTRPMPSRTEVLREYLDEKYGHRCVFCGKTDNLMPDHIDNNPENTSIKNFQWICRSCNYKKNPRIITKSEKERENVQAESKHERAGPEMQVAMEKQPEYDSWIYENLSREGGLTFFDALYEASKQVGISPITARRYLYQLLATTLTLGNGPRGHQKILWRANSEMKV